MKTTNADRVIKNEQRSIAIFCGITDHKMLGYIKACLSVAYNSGAVEAYAKMEKHVKKS